MRLRAVVVWALCAVLAWPAVADEASGSGSSGLSSGTSEFGGSSDPAASAGEPSAGDGAGLGNAGGGLTQEPAGTAGEEAAGDEQADGEAESEEAQSPDAAAEPEAAAAQATSSDDTAGLPPEITAPDVSFPEAGGNGSLRYSFGIEVPAFRGLEPRFALTYNSARKTKTGGLYQGWLGYGWGLDGFDVIERMRPQKGAPAFDANDVFVLNGMELVPCGQGVVSPSCSSGGTHATENESYLRIRFDAAGNYWEITDNQGTTTTLSSVGTIAGAGSLPAGEANDLAYRARWLVTRVADTHNNAVGYTYTCLELPVCYPLRVNYNGVTVHFHRQTRPDYILAANGHSISQVTQRIRTIRVTVNNVNRAAFMLDYDQAPVSNASRLVAIRQFGSDLAMDATGSVTSGSERPQTSLTYHDFKGEYDATNALYGSVFGAGDPIPLKVNDLNDDGRDELIYRGGDVVALTYARDNTLVARVSLSDQELLPRGDVKFYRLAQVGRYKADLKQKHWLHYTNGAKRITRIEDDLSNSTVNCNSTTDPELTANCDRIATSWDPLFNRFVTFAADPDGDGVDEYHHHKTSGPSSVLGVSNFHGDGKNQIMVQIGTGGGASVIRLLVYNGTNWVETIPVTRDTDGNTLPLPCGVPRSGALRNGCRIGDFNGDGVDDLLELVSNYSCTETGGGTVNCSGGTVARLFLGSGKGFVFWPFAGGNGSRGIPGHAYFTSTGDLDGDGRDEILAAGSPSDSQNLQDPYYLPRAGTYYRVSALSLRMSSSGFNPVVVPNLSLDGGDGHGDFNGDGLVDTAYHSVGCRYYGDQEQCTTSRHAMLSRPSTALPNLLTSVVNQQGGVASFEYLPSTVWSNDFLPHPVATVTKLKLDDGRGQVAEHGFAYEGGLYDPAARKFLGFRKVIETKPLANGEVAAPKVETTYRQDLASYGLPAETLYRDGGGTVRKKVVETYQVKLSAKPYWVQNTASETTFTENISQTLRVERLFDAYGNLTQVRDHGRVDVAGDESWTVRGYAPNTGAYITALPRFEWVRPGIDLALEPVKVGYFYYDGSTDHTQPPTVGDVTRKQHRVSYDTAAPFVWVTETFTYDGWGNKLTAVDGEGNKTQWFYDGAQHLFPIAERNPRFFANGGEPADTRHATQTTWDPLCQAPLVHTDLNDVEHHYSYDAFCRPLTYTNATTNHFRQYYYFNDGNPTAQNWQVYEPLPNNAGRRYQIQYYDGRGRVWREQTRGETMSSPVRRVETVHDARSNVAKKSHPYFVGDAVHYTVNAYDFADRVIRTTNPDGTARTHLYRLIDALSFTDNVPHFFTRTDDELGRGTVTYHSTWGDVIRVTRIMEDGATRHEFRSYDRFKRLIKLRDHGGAEWSYSYDLLGNRLAVSDPDLGDWSYRYDRANRLVRQTDARGVVTTMRYDQLGRLLERRVAAPSVADPVLVQNTYDEARTGLYNMGQLTTSANAAATHTIDWRASGNEARRASVVGGKSHITVMVEDKAHQPLRKVYYPGPLEVGTGSAPWTYTANGALHAIPGYIDAIEYEADGQTRRIDYANGVHTEFTYSPERRWLTRVRTVRPNGGVPLDNAYTRDAVGRITAIAGQYPGDNWSYSYNHLDWLLEADNLGNDALDETFTYTASGNLVSRSRLAQNFAYPAGTGPRPHAPARLGTTPITYDANGNMVSDGARQLAWDEANRLSTVTMPGGQVVGFAYGPDGARVKKSHALGETLYPAPEVEIDNGGGVTGVAAFTRYPHPDIKVTGAGTKAFLHRDHLASVRYVTDEAGNIRYSGAKRYSPPCSAPSISGIRHPSSSAFAKASRFA